MTKNSKAATRRRKRRKLAQQAAAANGQQGAGALRCRRAAAYLDLSIPTLHRLVKRGVLTPNRMTRHLLFPITELDRFLREGMTE